MPKSIDEIVLELLNKVEEKKTQIGAAERPTWLTNCQFKYVPSVNDTVNLQTVREEEVLVDIYAFLVRKAGDFQVAAQDLKQDKVKFKYLGFTLNEWLTDIQTRLSSLSIKKQREELAKLEERVNALVSPDQRRNIELAKLVKELN